MKKVFLFSFFLLGLSAIFFSPKTTSAQVFSPSQDVVLTLDPIMPLPGENVRVYLTSNLYDLNSYAITWNVDGKTVESGVGTTSINVEAPFIRKDKHVVEVLIRLDGRTVQKVVQVQGRSVVILEQSDNTTFFPGYRGRKVPSREEDLKIVAIPDESFSPTVDYTWDKNYIAGLPSLSGTGKNSIVIPATIFTDISTLGLEVEDLETRRKMRTYKDISFEAQSIGFYGFTAQNNPNFLHQEIGTYELNKRGAVSSLLAYPFGFNVSLLKKPEINWSLNNELVEQYQNNLIIPLQNEDSETSGTIDLTVEINRSETLSQLSANGIIISY